MSYKTFDAALELADLSAQSINASTTHNATAITFAGGKVGTAKAVINLVSTDQALKFHLAASSDGSTFTDVVSLNTATTEAGTYELAFDGDLVEKVVPGATHMRLEIENTVASGATVTLNGFITLAD